MDGWFGLVQILTVAVLLVPILVFVFVWFLTYIDVWDQQGPLHSTRMKWLQTIAAGLWLIVAFGNLFVRQELWPGALYLAAGITASISAIWAWRQAETTPSTAGSRGDSAA